MKPILYLLGILLIVLSSCMLGSKVAREIQPEQRIIGGWQTAVDEEGLDVHGIARDRLSMTFYSDRCTAQWGETDADLQDYKTVAYHVFAQASEYYDVPILLIRSICDEDERAIYGIEKLDSDSLIITRLDLENYAGDKKSTTLRFYRVAGPPENFK